jgi:hypothetical protein
MTNLFFNWYEHPTRQHEIDYCLAENRKVFDQVVIVYDRPTFAELFRITERHPASINCFCNSDIYFKKETIHLLNGIKADECYALTRYNLINGKEVFFNRRDSFDSYIFRGVIKKINADFTSGKWGCDNRLAYEIKQAGYTVRNPSLDIRTVHVHAVDDRNHVRTKDNTVPPPYHLVPPTRL